MNKPKLSLGDMWLRSTPVTTNAEILQKENDRMRGLCKEAADVIAQLRDENLKLRVQLKTEVPEKKLAPLIPSTAMRFIKKPYIVRESKFGAISESTQYTNVLQQWWSETGGRHDTNGEWRNVESVNGV